MLKARASDRPPIQKNGKNNNHNVVKNNSFNFAALISKKYLSRIFVFIILMSILGVFVTPMLVNLRVWKPEIVMMLESITNKQALIDGDIKLNIFPSPEVQIEGVRLIDPEENYQKDFLKLETMRANVNFWSLVKGKIVVEKIELDGFELFLTEKKDGSPNWIIKKNIHNKTDKQVLSNNNLALEDDTLHNFDANNIISFADIEIKEYEFLNGVIFIDNEKLTFDVGIDELKIRPADQINNLVSGTLEIYGEEVKVNSNFAYNSKSVDQLESIISLKHQDLSVHLDVVIDYVGPYPNIEGNFEIASKNIKKFIEKTFNKSSLFLISSIPLKSRGKIRLFDESNDLEYEIENLSISLGKTNFNGAINGIAGTEQKIELVLSSNSVDLDNMEFLLSTDIFSYTEDSKENFKGIKKEENYWDKLDASMLITIGTAKLNDYPIRDIIIDLKKKSMNYTINKSSAIFPGNTKINIEGDFGSEFEVFKGRTDFYTEDFKSYAKWLNIENINFFSPNKFRAVNFMSDLVYRPGASTFAGIEGKLDGTNFSGEMRLRWGKDTNLSAKLNLDKINLDTYLDDSYAKDDSKNEKKENKKKIEFKEVLNNEIAIDLNLSVDELTLSGTSFKGLRYLGSIKDNVISINNLSINNFVGLSLLGKGQVNFFNDDPEYNLDFKLKSEHINFSDFYKMPKNTSEFFIGDFEGNFKLEGTQSSLDSKIESRISDVNLSYTGNINLKSISSPILDGDIFIKFENIKEYLSKKIGITDSLFTGEGIFSSKFYLDEDTLNMEDLVFKSDDLKFTGKTKIDYDENKINFLTIINGNHVKADDMFSLLKFMNLFSFDSENKNDKEIIGTLRLNLEKLNLYDIVLNQVKIHSKLEHKNIAIKSMSADIYDGSLSLKSSVQLFDNPHAYSRFSLHGVNASKFTKNILGWNFLDGKLFMNIEVESKNNDIREAITNFNGTGNIELKNVFIKDFNPIVFKNISQVKSSEQINKIIKNSYKEGPSSIKSISSKLKIENSNVIFEKVSLEFDEILASISGNIDFVNNTSETILNIYLEKPDNANIGLIYSGKWDRIKKSTIIKMQEDKKEEEKILSSREKEFKQTIEKVNDEGDEKSFVALQEKENTENTQNYSEAENIHHNLEKRSMQKSDANIRLPKLLNKKKINNPFYNVYSANMNSVKNNIVKPVKPSQEDLLDNVLDSILE